MCAMTSKTTLLSILVSFAVPSSMLLTHNTVSASLLDITWISPSGGESYGPGSFIVGKWQAAQNFGVLSFRLCEAAQAASSQLDGLQNVIAFTGDESQLNCGMSVQPPMQSDNDGSYQTTIGAPNVTTPSRYLLKMEDSSGDTSLSPVFGLSAVDLGSPASSSLSSPMKDSDSPGIVMSNDTPSRKKLSPAAYAVPLAIAGSILFISGVIGFHHRKKLDHERQIQSQEFKSFRSQFTDNLGRLRGLSMWATQLVSGGVKSQGKSGESNHKEDLFTPVYVPQMAYEKRRPRQTTREPFRPRRTVHADSSQSTLSPRIAYVHGDESQVHSQRNRSTVQEEDAAANAEVTHSVVSHYLRASPLPASCPTPLKPAHVRRYRPRDNKRH